MLKTCSHVGISGQLIQQLLESATCVSSSGQYLRNWRHVIHLKIVNNTHIQKPTINQSEPSNYRLAVSQVTSVNPLKES